MTSALDSHFGLAKQVAKGTAITADASFNYFFFSDGPGMTPVPVVLPLDQEIGSGPLIRDMQRVAISTAGNINFIPRPSSVGHLLLGALGAVSTTVGGDFNTHIFKFAADQFSLPYFTARRRTAALGGEVFPDVRVAQLQFNFKAANYLRAAAQFVGIGLPTKVATTLWAPSTYLDATPPLLTCKGALNLPTGTALKALSGSITIGNVMPLEEQMIVGQLTPDDAEVNSRAVIMSLVVKADADLYEKMMYDPAKSGSWVPGILREADMKIQFQSASDAGEGQPYDLSFAMNGTDEASGTANVAWSVAPISLRGNRQVLMQVTGVVLADTTSAVNGPFSATLINNRASY